MKKLLLMMAAVAMTAQTVSAQQSAIVESKATDNWYVGVAGGVSAKTTHTAILKNLNPSAGIRVGRQWTPVTGWAIEGQAYFNDKKFGEAGTFVKAVNVNALGTLNFSNWFCGYQGSPRFFEVGAVLGLGLNHIFGLDAGVDKNTLTSKLGLEFMFNLGEEKAWQIYVQPAIIYDLDGEWRYDYTYGPWQRNKYDINGSALQLLVGVNYKLGNSNGTHNFVKGAFRDQAEIDALNAQINQLRSDNDAKDGQLNANARTIAQLKADLEACKNKPVPTATVKETASIQPAVLFKQGSSAIEANQALNVELVAKFLKENPDARIAINGYASPEGNAKLNQRLSEARAAAVKDLLVKKYGIDASRLDVQGLGATDKIFDKVEFNRVATFQNK